MLKRIGVLWGIAFLLLQHSGIEAAGWLQFDDIEIKSLQTFQSFGELHESVPVLIRAADKIMKQTPDSVVNKTVAPISGDMHDYVSSSPYWWSDPTQKGKYVSKDGRVNPERDDPARYDHDRLDRTASNINILSQAYCATGREEYAAKAVEFIKVFFVNPDTRMNPNLNFAQGIPGKYDGRGSGIIDSACLIRLIDNLHMLEKSAAFTEEVEAAMKAWFASYLEWLMTSKAGLHESQAMNNHGVWYDAQAGAYALYVGRNDIAASIVRQAASKRIDQQIEPDGSMPKELARTKSMNYTTFNLCAFITLARIGDEVGVNLWDYHSSDGRSIKAAIDYFIPYVLDTRGWQHEQIIAYRYPGFTRFLYLAKMHYGTQEYDTAIQKLAMD
ncbi:MAG: Alginate lyase [Firmicutes bacterium]|nr:Alginate lyase [Bacillota bacterium]